MTEPKPKMSIEMFIKERLGEWQRTIVDVHNLLNSFVDFSGNQGYTIFDRLQAQVQAMLGILEWHQNWPVLVETPPKFEPNMFDDFDAGLNSYTMKVSQQIGWLTQQEYRKRFGSEPPTAPVVALLAAIWADHPDYDLEWGKGLRANQLAEMVDRFTANTANADEIRQAIFGYGEGDPHD